ncbi:MAG: V-type ATP synthase subunit A [Sulfolobales archaeon]|nr:V-type ATP synthase subunit A [Sulfolobales archaeon]MCX8185639.1 V-type ATP synthase subunit A [Sulfolobales archaeon]
MVIGKVWRVSGPLVIAENMSGSMIYEVVYIGNDALIGEIIGIQGDKAFIQVYEDTSGVSVGEPVEGSGKLLSAELGPGLIGKVFDGLQRPLSELEVLIGPFVKRGVKASSLPKDVKWFFRREKGLEIGSKVGPNDIIGYVEETPIMTHKIMVPHGVSGYLKEVVGDGDYRVDEVIARVESGGKVFNIKMYQEWPIRKSRPYVRRLEPTELLITGTRVLDALFPVAVGGKAAVPGGFGSGKTVLLQTLTKWSRTHINIYVGCGERGNEMADALHSFKKLVDPSSGRPLYEKAIFIANTSNMPVAARETSVFLGATLGEYFRDMGYDVLLVADSTSRWAEAMREISARMEEMPGEEGFPAYLGSRLASFYERSGRVECVGNPSRSGSLTIFGAVSPPGADFSEPVTQNTLRYIGTLISLDVSLANRRHFPSVSWLLSYSLYVDNVSAWWSKFNTSWSELRREFLRLLQKEAELMEIVRLVGPDALPDQDKLILEVSKMIREDFLQQSAYHPIDSYSPPEKTLMMMDIILKYYKKAYDVLLQGVPLVSIKELPIRAKISRMKEVSPNEFSKFYVNIVNEIEESFNNLVKGVVG